MTQKEKRRLLDTNNLGAFYKFINNKLRNSTGVAPLYDSSGILLASDLKKANLLNEYFESVFINDDGNLPNLPSRLPTTTPPTGINDITITPKILLPIMKKLRTNSAAGPDKFPPVLFKNTRDSLALPLSVLFRNYIDLHELPNEWKFAIITPKFKPGSPSTPSNYRPIALTCTCCEILESVISDQLITFLNNHSLITKAQHGFLKRHSTTTNLMESLNSWTITLANHKSVTIAYVDFLRAFDSISPNKLLHKLEAYGISGNLLLWIKAFLSHRTQAVRVGSSISSTCSIISGVPQGSVLGPVFFNIFINDIVDLFDPTTCTAKLFADDLKLFTVISDQNSFSNFQSNLDSLHSWSIMWQIGISNSKSFIFNLGPSQHQLFSIGNSTLNSPTIVKDLGIIVDTELKFNNHIFDIVKKANQRAILIHRSFLSKNTTNLLLAYTINVRPLLEYATPVWNPSQLGLINTIESVQRKFTKQLPGLSNFTYYERLQVLQLQTLEHRWLQYDLQTCFNIVHGINCLESHDFFTMSSNSKARGYPLRITVPIAKSNISKHFFSCRVVHPWNSLPSNLVVNPNPTNFKFRLRKINLNKFLTQPSVTFI